MGAKVNLTLTRLDTEVIYKFFLNIIFTKSLISLEINIGISENRKAQTKWLEETVNFKLEK